MCPRLAGSRAEVAEWQTRRSQTPLRATSCGFESHLRHHHWQLRGSREQQLGVRYREARTPLTSDIAERIVRSVDRRVYDHLKLAILDLGSQSSFMRSPVRQAKDDARMALVAFQAQSLSPALREASIVLGQRLEDIQTHQPALNWKPLLHAWEALERVAEHEVWD